MIDFSEFTVGDLEAAREELKKQKRKAYAAKRKEREAENMEETRAKRRKYASNRRAKQSPEDRARDNERHKRTQRLNRAVYKYVKNHRPDVLQDFHGLHEGY